MAKPLARRLEPFLAKRLPPSTEQTLSHKGIFILPSGFGLAWLVLTLLLYLLGTNYQNNLILAISLLLTSLFVTCMIYSYRNLEGVTLKRRPLPPIYAGETLAMPLSVSAARDVHQLALAYPGVTPVYLSVFDEDASVLVPVPTEKRGLLNPGRLKVESRFPLGLMRTWTWVDLAIEHPVFASHKEGKMPPFAHAEAGSENEAGLLVTGMDEYQGLRTYIPGESLKQVAWKQLAQGRGMLSKDFARPQGAPEWLALDSLKEGTLEERLSLLSFWVDELAARQQVYGLILPGVEIPPGSGEPHRLACQTAMATFDAPYRRELLTQGQHADKQKPADGDTQTQNRLHTRAADNKAVENKEAAS